MKKQNFNTGWLFSAVGGEQAMKPVTLPHDAMLYEKRSKDAATAGVCGYSVSYTHLTLPTKLEV